jgi:hypothetical protein
MRMNVSCEYCMLSGRGLYVRLITCPEESFTECGVSECDREASIMGRPCSTGGCYAMGDKNICIGTKIYVLGPKYMYRDQNICIGTKIYVSGPKFNAVTKH